MTFTFTPAPPPTLRTNIFGAVAGMTGAGKTYSAMLLMSGLCGDRPWGIGDTEDGRGANYHVERLPPERGGLQYHYTQIEPPYTPERYEAVIADAVQAGLAGLVIDSGSHMWEGEGGVREQAADGIPDGKDVPFQKWARPKAAMWRAFEKAKLSPLHVIVCLRAKPKRKLVNTGKMKPNGKPETEVVSVGTLPIMDSAIWHEFDFLAVFEPERPGVPLWTAKPLALQYHGVFEDQQITQEHGRRLARVGASKTSAAQPEQPRRSMVTLRIGAEERQADIRTAATDLAGAVEKAGSKDDLDMLVKDNSVWIEELGPNWRDRLDAVIAEARERVG